MSNKPLAHLKFVINNRHSYFLALLLLVAMWFVDSLTQGKILTASNSLWKDILDPLVGLGTLFTAIVIWWEETRQDRRDSLPKRLTVRFQHQERLLMYCENAHLSAEGDIRALGQQIGFQMAGGKFDFKAPSVQVSIGEPQTDSEGNDYLPYLASFELTAIPSTLDNLKPDEYLAWLPPFDGAQVKRHA